MSMNDSLIIHLMMIRGDLWPFVFFMVRIFVFLGIIVTFASIFDMVPTTIFKMLIALIIANFKIYLIIRKIRIIRISPAGCRDHLPLQQGLRHTLVF